MTNELLQKEISRVFEIMEDADPNSEEYQALLETLEKLYRLNIDEFTVKVEKEKNRNDNRVKIIIEGAAIGTTLVFNMIWMRKGFRFEETGNYTSTTYRWLWSKFKQNFKFK